jgi:hypothetical protein
MRMVTDQRAQARERKRRQRERAKELNAARSHLVSLLRGRVTSLARQRDLAPRAVTRSVTTSQALVVPNKTLPASLSVTPPMPRVTLPRLSVTYSLASVPCGPVTPPVTPPTTNKVRCAVGFVPRCIVGVPLVGAAFALVWASVRANAWAGFALSVDGEAGRIFATLTVTAEVIAFLVPTANRLYRAMGETWSVLRGLLILIVAALIVGFAASGFVLTNVSDKTALRAQASPDIGVAQRALADAQRARDRECTRVGPICRQREDTVGQRQNELNAAIATAQRGAEALGLAQLWLLDQDQVREGFEEARAFARLSQGTDRRAARSLAGRQGRAGVHPRRSHASAPRDDGGLGRLL